MLQGDFQQARTLWEEDLALRKELGDRDGIGWTLTCLAELAVWEGDLEQAMSLYIESRDAFRKVGNQWAVSMAISGMGSIVLAKGISNRRPSFMRGRHLAEIWEILTHGWQALRSGESRLGER